MSRPNKRDLILDAAETLVRSRRFHEITLDEVAQTAKVGKGTIYRYFEDKEDLFFELATHGFDELCTLLSERIPGDDSFEKRLVSMCEQISRFFLERRPLVRMIMDQENRMRTFREDMLQRWLGRRERLVAVVNNILQDGLDQELIRRDIPLDFQARMLLGLMRERHFGFSDEPVDMPPVGLVVRLFLYGVGTNQLWRHGLEDMVSA
jgi:AcrR family transcriptional regulator